MKVELEGDGFSLLPEDDRAYGLALSILKFDLGFGGARQREHHERDKRSENGEGYGFHAGIIDRVAMAGLLMHQWAMLDPQVLGVYCQKVSHPLGKSAIMAVNAVEQVTEQFPADDFQALEEKIYRTIEMYKAARQAQATAERDVQRIRLQLEERDEQIVALRRETVQLKKEREAIRGRVEKMLEQIESIAEERAS
jgi:hypothetical protein